MGNRKTVFLMLESCFFCPPLAKARKSSLWRKSLQLKTKNEQNKKRKKNFQGKKKTKSSLCMFVVANLILCVKIDTFYVRYFNSTKLMFYLELQPRRKFYQRRFRRRFRETWQRGETKSYGEIRCWQNQAKSHQFTVTWSQRSKGDLTNPLIRLVICQMVYLFIDEFNQYQCNLPTNWL